MRWTPRQFCPACAKAPDAIAGTARSRSASGMTITGEFEPSSIDSFLRPAVRAMCSPVLTPPVNVTIRTRGSLTSASPSSPPLPVTMFSRPAGSPDAIRSRAKRSADKRRRRRRLEHDRVARHDRGAQLVREHRQRIVERRDRRDDADRKSEVIADAILGACAAVEGQRLAVDAAAFLGGQAQDRRRARRLAARLANGLAALARDIPRILVLRRLDAIGGAHQDVALGRAGESRARATRRPRHTAALT